MKIVKLEKIYPKYFDIAYNPYFVPFVLAFQWLGSRLKAKEWIEIDTKEIIALFKGG